MKTKNINWDLVSTVIKEIEDINYYIRNKEKYYVSKKYTKKIENKENIMTGYDYKILQPLKIYKDIEKALPNNLLIPLLTITNNDFIFSIQESITYNYNLLKNKKINKSIISDQDIKILGLMNSFYFIDLFDELKDKVDEYSILDRTIFAIIYELYDYFENKCYGMIFDQYYYMSTINEIYSIIIKQKDDELLKFEDFMINIDLAENTRLRNKIFRIYQIYKNSIIKDAKNKNVDKTISNNISDSTNEEVKIKEKKKIIKKEEN